MDDARVTKSETMIRRGKTWFRYDAPDKQLFEELQVEYARQYKTIYAYSRLGWRRVP